MKGVTSAIPLLIYIKQISDRRMKEGREGRRGGGERRGERGRLTYSCVHPRRRIHKLEQQVRLFMANCPLDSKFARPRFMLTTTAGSVAVVDILSPAKQDEK